ncbi:MAG: PepSY domain-containing protein [Pseudomonadota bacterium]|nr:PepSY domain-containing protein [Pseudomonadota bacterium]
MTSKKTMLSAIFIASTTIAFGAQAYTGAEFSKNAKINIQEARTIAIKTFPGKIIDEELENEQGGSGLRYSFDIKKNGATHEVGIDAQTGKVLENSMEGANPD